jgi:diguanylate cyclase (GGDEF)-like protein
LFDNKNTLVNCFIIKHDKGLIPQFLDWQSFAPFLAFALIPLLVLWLTLSKLIIPLEKFTQFLRRSVTNEDIKKSAIASPVTEIEQVRSTFNELCDIVNQQKHELEQLTKTDQLTGISNRRAFDHELERNWNHLGRYGGHCALVLCDLDFFKLFNDHYGHLHGDKVLKLVASTLEPFARRSDEICARFGGEEFILLMHFKDQKMLIKRLDDILAAINELQEPHSESSFGHLTLSLGISTLEVKENELLKQQSKDWIKQADDALYEAKEQGRNQYVLHPFKLTK